MNKTLKRKGNEANLKAKPEAEAGKRRRRGRMVSMK